MLKIFTNILSKNKENLNRQIEVDLARGFAAILIVIVHIGLYLGNDISNGLWTFCDIVGSDPCAPVLMMVMGISMIYSRHQSVSDMLKRGTSLFIMGYLLNAFRSLLPLIILGDIDSWTSIDAFFVVDILQFAGLSFMLIALLRKLKLNNIAIFALAIIMVIIGQYTMFDISLNSKLLTGIINLFIPTSEWSCFPLFTWFIFPAFGLLFGDLLTHCINKKKLYALLLPICLGGTIYVYYQFYKLYPDYTSYYWGNNFYFMGIKNVLLTLLIVIFCLSFWFFVEKILPNAIKKMLVFLSKNLNLYYIISWIVINILIHIQTLFNWKFNNWITIGLMIISVIAYGFITKLCLHIKMIKKNK